jgi:hypothetical protein
MVGAQGLETRKTELHSLKGLARIVELWPSLSVQAQAAMWMLTEQLARQDAPRAVLPGRIGGPVPNMVKPMPSPERPRACVPEVCGEVKRAEPAEETEEGKRP